MNRFLIAALISVALPAAALADPDHHDDHGQGAPHGEHHDGGQPGGHAAPAAQPAGQGGHAPGGNQGGNHGAQNGGYHGQSVAPAAQPAPVHNGAPGGNYHSQQNNSGPGNYHQNNAPGGYHSGPAGRPGGQFSYHGQNHSVIRGGFYRYPSGYGYRRWGIGMSLPLLFLTSTYYFNDYATYGFGPPPPGCRWVRYGPDLLLVNRHTGRVVDVIYGVFY